MEIEIYPSKFDLKTYPATKEQSSGGGSGGSGDNHNKGWYATPDQLPTTGENGDYAIVGSTDTVWVWDGDTSSWVDTDTKGQVESVNGKTGVVQLKAGDISIDTIDGLTSTEVQSALGEINSDLNAKQDKSDSALETSSKTIVGAINEINSVFNVNALPTPITDVKTITTTLEGLISDTQYANKPGTILINPNITNTGAILVGEAITDISKAFPIYTDQPVTIAFKNINDFKVAGEIAGESFNYVISFGYINQTISTNA